MTSKCPDCKSSLRTYKDTKNSITNFICVNADCGWFTQVKDRPSKMVFMLKQSGKDFKIGEAVKDEHNNFFVVKNINPLVVRARKRVKDGTEAKLLDGSASVRAYQKAHWEGVHSQV